MYSVSTSMRLSSLAAPPAWSVCRCVSMSASALVRPRPSRNSLAVSPASSQVDTPPQSTTTVRSPESNTTHSPWPTSSTVTLCSRPASTCAASSTAESISAEQSAGTAGRMGLFHLPGRGRRLAAKAAINTA